MSLLQTMRASPPHARLQYALNAWEPTCDSEHSAYLLSKLGYQNTSQVLARVSGGETVEITDRGRPVARLVPVGNDRSTLARLVATGRAVAPTGSGSVPLPPKLGAENVNVADTLAAMREEERW